MAKTRVVQTKFWSDDYVAELEPSGKLLFLYLITNDRTDICGAYETNRRRIAAETGLTLEEITNLLDQFKRDGKILFRNGWVLILNFQKNQQQNPSVLKGIKRSLSHCPDWVKVILIAGRNSEGQTVDSEGQTVDSEGQTVDSEGQAPPNLNLNLRNISSTFVDSSSLRSEESTYSDSSSEDARPDTGVDAPEPEASEADAGAPGKSSREVSPARTVFDAYRAILHPGAKFDEKRRKIINARLKDFTVEQLCRVPLGAKHTPWNMGDNPSNRKYIDIDLLYRNADKVEFFLTMAETVNGNSKQGDADIAAQQQCGCYEMGGLRKVGSKYLPCDHNIVIPVSESRESVVWPPPVQ